MQPHPYAPVISNLPTILYGRRTPAPHVRTIDPPVGFTQEARTIPQISSSLPTTNIKTIPTTKDIRPAASCPFHVADCHIKNHSAPTVRNATSHKSIPTVSPAIATFFAL